MFSSFFVINRLFYPLVSHAEASASGLAVSVCIVLASACFLHLRCLVVAALVCVILLLFLLTLIEKLLELSGQFAEFII